MKQETTITNMQNANTTFLILGVVLTTIIFVLIIIFVFYFKHRNKNQNANGFVFEDNMHELMKSICAKRNLTYFPGGTFEYEKKMFNVDGLIITPKILLVFEYKSYKGEVNGDARNDKFDLKDKNNKITKISNPIWQNQKHIEHLFKMFGFEFPAASIVVFEEVNEFTISHIPDDVFLISPKSLINSLDEIEEWSNSQENSVISVKDFKTKLEFHRTKTMVQNLKWNRMIKKTRNQKIK